MKTKREPNMKELRVTIKAICTVPVDFRLTSENYGAFEISHKDGETIRRMLIRQANVEVKDLFITPLEAK